MGTGSHLPLTLFSLLHLCADFSVASECAVACTPTPQPRRHPNLNTRCHCSTHPAPLTIHRLPCTPRPILDLDMLAARFTRRRTTACSLRSLRDSACGALTNACRCTFHPHSLPPLLLLPSLIPPSFPSSLFAPSFPLVLPISALARSSYPLPPRPVPPLHASPRAIAHWPCSTCCADVYPRPCRCRMLAAWHRLAELGFTADKCDVKPALHAPAPCARLLSSLPVCSTPL
jgi:hypothetical protein